RPARNRRRASSRVARRAGDARGDLHSEREQEMITAGSAVTARESFTAVRPNVSEQPLEIGQVKAVFLVQAEGSYGRIISDRLHRFEYSWFTRRRADHSRAQSSYSCFVALALLKFSGKLVVASARVLMLPCEPGEIERQVRRRDHRQRQACPEGNRLDF